MDDILAEYYYNNKFGLLSVDKFYRKLQDEGINISKAKVKAFIDKQETAQLTKVVKKKKKFNTIVAAFPGANYQMDLMIYDRYEYNNYKYTLNVIDVYSRFVQSRALTNKRLDTIILALKEIFGVMGWPKNLNCDNEFNKKQFLDFVAPHHVIMWFSQPNDIRHNAVVERFNRTLASGLQKWRTATGKHNWAKVLPEIVDNYNTTYHTTLKGKPVDVWEKRKLNRQKINPKQEPTFKENDKVRIKIQKSLFDKGDVHTFTKEIYVVSNVIGNRVYLEDSRGNVLDRWYRPEDLLNIDTVESIPQIEEEERIHKKTKQKKKIKRTLNKEGIDEVDIIPTGKRKPPVKKVYKPKIAAPKPKPIKKPQEEFEVKTIHGTQKVKGQTFYITEWIGYPNFEEWTYEPKSHIDGTAAFKRWKKENK